MQHTCKRAVSSRSAWTILGRCHQISFTGSSRVVKLHHEYEKGRNYATYKQSLCSENWVRAKGGSLLGDSAISPGSAGKIGSEVYSVQGVVPSLSFPYCRAWLASLAQLLTPWTLTVHRVGLGHSLTSSSTLLSMRKGQRLSLMTSRTCAEFTTIHRTNCWRTATGTE